MIHRCLDTIEALVDPRPGVTGEVSSCRDTQLNLKTSERTNDRGCSEGTETLHPWLTDLLTEIKTLNSELEQRRQESLYIHDRLRGRCQRLEEEISDREAEIHEL